MKDIDHVSNIDPEWKMPYAMGYLNGHYIHQTSRNRYRKLAGRPHMAASALAWKRRRAPLSEDGNRRSRGHLLSLGRRSPAGVDTADEGGRTRIGECASRSLSTTPAPSPAIRPRTGPGLPRGCGGGVRRGRHFGLGFHRVMLQVAISLSGSGASDGGALQ